LLELLRRKAQLWVEERTAEGSWMRYFKIEFEVKTRPPFRKGRWRREDMVYAADSDREALQLATDEAKRRWPRRKWQLMRWEELTPPVDVSPCHPGQAEVYAELSQPRPKETA
jgi:hypothetical protein